MSSSAYNNDSFTNGRTSSVVVTCPSYASANVTIVTIIAALACTDSRAIFSRITLTTASTRKAIGYGTGVLTLQPKGAFNTPFAIFSLKR